MSPPVGREGPGRSAQDGEPTTARLVPLHRSPGAGFDDPFAMLAACHERVLRMLDLLLRLADHLQVDGADGQARSAARDVLRYFDMAGPAHHEDEERHVFPALLRQPGAPLKPLVRRLKSDHLLMARRWQTVRADLQAMIAGPDGQGRPNAQTLRRWQDFAALYCDHISAEDDQAYTAAKGLLDAPACADMGREMAQRRGTPVGGPTDAPRS